MKSKYYSLDKIFERCPDAKYYMLIGQRSNGKTYACLNHCLKEYKKTGMPFAYMRRWKEDFKGKRGNSLFDALVLNGVIEEITDGQWTGVKYYAARWFFTRQDEKDPERVVTAENPFCYAFAISEMEHDKSSSFPTIKNVIFDEFLTHGMYLPDEFILFMNSLSTIIRDRSDVTVFMAANTVNKYSPYFNEMGLTNVKDMKPGEIQVYQYGETDLKVAVEFTDMPAKRKDSDVYFAFGNSRLDMITGRGEVWELDMYPHSPCKLKPKDVIFSYFIVFDREIYQADVCKIDKLMFTFIHKKTTPIQKPDKDIVFQVEYDPRPNYFRDITRPSMDLTKKIWNFFMTDRVYYQDNVTGNAVTNYINWCKSEHLK